MTLLPKPDMIEVLHGQENIIKTTLIGFQDIEKQLDGCFDHTGPSAIFADEEGTIWNALLGLMRRGIKLRYLTQITKDNISYCKEMAKERLEVRHLDGVKGNFGISDRRDCMIYAIQKEGHPPTQIIFTNVKSFVEQQQYFFDMLWNKAIPSDQKIREIEEGIVPEFIHTIETSMKYKNLALIL
jgi:two-component system, OmpR family, sensor histidine kinase VicK